SADKTDIYMRYAFSDDGFRPYVVIEYLPLAHGLGRDNLLDCIVHGTASPIPCRSAADASRRRALCALHAPAGRALPRHGPRAAHFFLRRALRLEWCAPLARACLDALLSDLAQPSTASTPRRWPRRSGARSAARLSRG